MRPLQTSGATGVVVLGLNAVAQLWID